MKKFNAIGLIFIFVFALMATFLFRYRPLNTVKFQEGEPAAKLLTLPETRRSLGPPIRRPIGTGLSGFEVWYEQLPDWLASNSFPAYVLPETRSLAVSLRALYAETNATPRALQAGHDLVANELIWGPQSNIFCRTLSQRFLLKNEVSSRLFIKLSNKVREFNE
jgi:hypothetical protein